MTSATFNVLDLALESLRTDGGTQPRAELSETVVGDYAEAIDEGVKFPPLVAFHDGVAYWLADGFHRFFAARKAGLLSVLCHVVQGTRRDAVLYSAGANATHGMQRTQEDKRRAVLTLLRDPEWSKWSDREIAQRCGVTTQFVYMLRPVQSDPQRSLTVPAADGAGVERIAPAPVPVRGIAPPAEVTEAEDAVMRDAEARIGLDAMDRWMVARHSTDRVWWEDAFLKFYVETDGDQAGAAQLAGVTPGLVKSHKHRNEAFRLRVKIADEEVKGRLAARGLRSHRARASEALGRIIGAGEE